MTDSNQSHHLRQCVFPGATHFPNQQEGKAEKAAEAIKAMLSSNAVVVRDGQRKQIPAEDLVPGDIVVIKSGDKIPADVRLIQTANLQVGWPRHAGSRQRNSSPTMQQQTCKQTWELQQTDDGFAWGTEHMLWSQ
jgi:predicted NUDIX family NTP pyrophosphohydrolase